MSYQPAIRGQQASQVNAELSQVLNFWSRAEGVRTAHSSIYRFHLVSVAIVFVALQLLQTELASMPFVV